MYRASFRPFCEILLASVLLSVACKSAPIKPDFSETTSSENQLQELEAERAEILEAQKQLDNDIKMAEEGWPAGKPAPKVEATYTSKGGKYDEPDIIECKQQIQKCAKQNNRTCAQPWYKKLGSLCKAKKAQLNSILVDVEVKIEKCCNKEYGDIIPRTGEPDGRPMPPAETKPEGPFKIPPEGTGSTLPVPKGDPGQRK